ncbi:hypothetical protein [Bifidobacterium platyrrhinorum]|uniref:Uncharacterized protein n=1 Tax=Bifidobacterium platyrrhinorum TaxID=2661628 RepID=A0A6L9ST95_9BIFI|nr:hypothetical protein [Bifidobacterium platyrrhinorum]NEG54742.1 hypothetical protein [Bifidobacterium platyrrhinorum]
MGNSNYIEQFIESILGSDYVGPVDSTPAGFASHAVLQRMVKHSSHGYTAIERATDGEVKYNRVRDICIGQKAPAKVSEVIAMARACGQEPLEIFYRITGLENNSRNIWEAEEPGEDVLNEWMNHFDRYTLFDESERRACGFEPVRNDIIKEFSGDDVVVGTYGKDGKTYAFTARIRMEG